MDGPLKPNRVPLGGQRVLGPAVPGSDAYEAQLDDLARSVASRNAAAMAPARRWLAQKR
jgi:hypothetical protein